MQKIWVWSQRHHGLLRSGARRVKRPQLLEEWLMEFGRRPFFIAGADALDETHKDCGGGGGYGSKTPGWDILNSLAGMSRVSPGAVNILYGYFKDGVLQGLLVELYQRVLEEHPETVGGQRRCEYIEEKPVKEITWVLLVAICEVVCLWNYPLSIKQLYLFTTGVFPVWILSRTVSESVGKYPWCRWPGGHDDIQRTGLINWCFDYTVNRKTLDGKAHCRTYQCVAL